MKYNSKKVLSIITIICLILVMSGNVFAHSGRTDSSGGHKDNQNKSGLGSYHYHCSGNPPHLHENGVCPYSSSSSSKSSSSESIATSSSVESTPAPNPIIEATNIEINESITSMKVGETDKLTATIIPENTEDKTISWTSSDEDIATVSSTGKVVALKEGTINITVTTSNGKTDTIEITVEEVKEIKEENAPIVVPIQSNELNNTSTNTEENSNIISGVLGLGIIGGGIYWAYKKYIG